MEFSLIAICVIGVVMFGAYMFFIVKTSMDDVKEKKLEEELRKNGKL